MGADTKINPMLIEFLDCKTNAQKIRVLNKYRQEWTRELLIVIEGALELATPEEENVETHYYNLLKVLEMKKKYEEAGLR